MSEQGSRLAGGLALAVLGLAFVGGTVVATDFTAVGLSDHEQVNGTVVETGLEQTASPNQYEPVVVYEYEYGGEQYRNDDYYPGVDRSLHEPEARDLIAPHDRGDTVQVYVAPDDPTDAFLRSPTFFDSAASVLAAIVGVLVGGAMLVGGTKLVVTDIRGGGG